MAPDRRAYRRRNVLMGGFKTNENWSLISYNFLFLLQKIFTDKIFISVSPVGNLVFFNFAVRSFPLPSIAEFSSQNDLPFGRLGRVAVFKRPTQPWYDEIIININLCSKAYFFKTGLKPRKPPLFDPARPWERHVRHVFMMGGEKNKNRNYTIGNVNDSARVRTWLSSVGN